MSRALGRDVKEAIKHGDNQTAFEEIAGVLALRLAELLEMEFLGQSHVPDAHTSFLRDGAAVAIPKARLVQAFIFARQLLMDHISGKGRRQPLEVLKATAVILLMDPEHLTAANTRKRLLNDIIGSATGIQENLHHEKYFVDSLLTSRLHRHTKSPTLWGHRQWLMERFRDSGLAIDTLPTMRAVVFVAAERHSRNYYAWRHARYLANAISLTSADQLGDQQLPAMLEASKKWCFSHHDDVSGWAFLLFFLHRHPIYAAPVFTETLKLAASFHWRNESVWYFLRNMLWRPAVGDGQEVEFHSTRTALQEGAEEGTDQRRVLDQALKWVETYSA